MYLVTARWFRPGIKNEAPDQKLRDRWRVPVSGTFRRCRRFSSACDEPDGFREPGGHAVGTLIGILITFLVIILVLYLINMLPLDGRAKQIARIVVIIIGVISLLKYLAVF